MFSNTLDAILVSISLADFPHSKNLHKSQQVEWHGRKSVRLWGRRSRFTLTIQPSLVLNILQAQLWVPGNQRQLTPTLRLHRQVFQFCLEVIVTLDKRICLSGLCAERWHGTR